MYKWSFLTVFIAFKTSYKQSIAAKDLYTAPKKKFGNSFGNRTMIMAEMEENTELVDVFGNGKARCGLFHAHFISLDLIERIRFINRVT